MLTGVCRGAHRKTPLLDCKLKGREERLNKLETSEVTPTPQEHSPVETETGHGHYCHRKSVCPV